MEDYPVFFYYSLSVLSLMRLKRNLNGSNYKVFIRQFKTRIRNNIIYKDAFHITEFTGTKVMKRLDFTQTVINSF